MNPLIIVLGIVIIVFLYYIIQYYFFNSKSLAAKIYLKDSPVDISSNIIINPNSVIYTFGTWVYVNNFSTSTLLSYTNPSETLFSLKLGPSTPKLTTEIKGASGLNISIITNNFPIQKWVHVLVSVDTLYADCYLDGKLVISKKLDYPITNSPTSTPGISFAQTGDKPDIYLAKVTRWDHPLDPQTVYTEYSAGNGLNNSDLSVGLLVATEDANNTYPIYSN